MHLCPVCNVFDVFTVQIRYQGKWEGVGPRKLREFFWALWNGIEPIGECHFTGPKKLESFCAAFGRGCLQQPVLHLEIGWAVWFVGFFYFFFVCFETGLLVSVVAIQVRNTKTNWKNVFDFVKQTKNTAVTDWVSVCFCSNRTYFLFVSRTP
jgi:hypothetical protein